MDKDVLEFLATYEADLKAFFEALIKFFKTIFEIKDAEETPEA